MADVGYYEQLLDNSQAGEKEKAEDNGERATSGTRIASESNLQVQELLVTDAMWVVTAPNGQKYLLKYLPQSRNDQAEHPEEEDTSVARIVLKMYLSTSI